ncbi:hypothetical protein [Micavibrio aeruginosavorus]|uniref:Uncharacterized protein n=1 Tax=Micavibrio aeruginosavorus (strain ARL-13) TaxID=856793 RepID=G2KLH6_MICAA|nr:hypothetical protein [Micavibrio aeruginosavorus]AEP08412.1 hypothetical protein MICA_64 [Micavibrio aeruginosavorus ARL-13]
MEQYGWFEYEDAPWKIRNFKSGQELILKDVTFQKLPEEFLKKWASDNRAKLIRDLFPQPEYFEYSSELEFLYKDTEIEQILCFSIKYEKDKHRRFGITIDYNKIFETSPSYGLWRRIDDFFVDVALCWPEGVFDERPFGLIVIGAWYQGKWRSDVKRIFSGRKAGKREVVASYPIVEPHLEPLHSPAPQQWTYIDVAEPKAQASLKFCIDETYNIPFFSQDEQLVGFQERVPYLLRNDQKAAIFPALLEPNSHRGEDPDAHLYYTYVDEDVFFTFRSCLVYGLELSDCKNYGFRKLPPDPRFFASDALGAIGDSTYVSRFGSSCLSYFVWRRALNAIMDAWPNWKNSINFTVDGMARKIEIDPSINLPPNYGRQAYVGNFGPTITRGFCGGMVNNWYCLKFETPEMYENIKLVRLIG